ncbi:MAG: hypothetical protein IT319_07915 [Anaerolineae bacterium]|nr:hypothetical protein [Anaerolineae bacterium]
MTIKPASAQDEVYEFLTSQPTPEEIIGFRPSEEAEERLGYLLDTNQTDRLTKEERVELDEYLKLEHFMRMLKIKAREKLARV